MSPTQIEFSVCGTASRAQASALHPCVEIAHSPKLFLTLSNTSTRKKQIAYVVEGREVYKAVSLCRLPSFIPSKAAVIFIAETYVPRRFQVVSELAATRSSNRIQQEWLLYFLQERCVPFRYGHASQADIASKNTPRVCDRTGGANTYHCSHTVMLYSGNRSSHS